ncbi:cytosolic phospholipase A2 zeta, partial [Xylariaceae sp. FL0594]
MRTFQRSHLLDRAWRRTAQLPIFVRASQSHLQLSLANRRSLPRAFFSWGATTRQQQQERQQAKNGIWSYATPASLFLGGLLIYTLYPGDELRRARLAREAQYSRLDASADALLSPRRGADGNADAAAQSGGAEAAAEPTAWDSFSKHFEDLSKITDIEWSTVPDRIVDLVLPEWYKAIPRQIRKLQSELTMSDGSLADEIWREAKDPYVHPEIQYSAKVRVSEDLCEEEKEFLGRRKKVALSALARYLDLDEKEIHPADVPTIAMCGSGGGLRALVAGTGSLLASQEDGLFDCVTYTSGVSGSCWLQTLYHSSLTERRLDRLVDHLKARLGVHFAFPPAAFSAVTSSPTNKLLLSGMVEKLRGDSNASFGLVDVYGILLAARLLVPKGELGINEKDYKLSNQREYVKYGQNPLPIYTAVRHEIPDIVPEPSASPTEDMKEIAKQEGWFQWFELTPYEFFCEEFNAGIPTWALGRRFNRGKDVLPQNGSHLPEIRMPLLLGMFGSAFCATLSHYYREIRPLVRSLTGFGAIDEMIYGYNGDLEKVHPIDPASVPNFVYGMGPELRFTTPTSIHQKPYIQLMDAGMSNNLPIYPLLRPGRDVDIVVAFDASADIKTDNWLSVADGYARQRGVKGWPIGIGWPKGTDSAAKIEQQLETAQAESPADADAKLAQAKQEEEERARSTTDSGPDNAKAKAQHDQSHPEDSDLGHCTVWVGTTEERSSEPPPPSKALTDDDSWKLMEPNAGLTLIYLPFLANPDKVPGVDPAQSDYMSTWNFVYTPEQIDGAIALARANYAEGKDTIKRTVRAVYERKKKMREEAERQAREDRFRRRVRRGVVNNLGEGDHF